MRRRRMFSPVPLAVGGAFMIALVVLQVGYAMWPAPWPFSLIWSDDVSTRGRQLVRASFAFTILAFGACAIGLVFAIWSMRRTTRLYDRSVRAWPPALRRGSERWVLVGFLPGVTICWPLLPDYVPILRNGMVFGGVVLGASVVAGVSFF